MLFPNGTHLIVRRKLTAFRLRKGFCERGFFLGGQLNQRLLFAGELQEHARKFVLHLGGKAAHGFEGVFEQFSHVSSQAIEAGRVASLVFLERDDIATFKRRKAHESLYHKMPVFGTKIAAGRDPYPTRCFSIS
jgi:hypothetical protein